MSKKQEINILYQRYCFSFETVTQFANELNITTKKARKIVRIGRKINNVAINEALI